MKPHVLPLWLIALAGFAFAQTTEPAATGQPEILGQIPDGTPTAATPEPEPYEVKPKDIVSTTVSQDGDQTITVHQIKPIDLPPPPEPAPAPTPQSLIAFQQRLAQRQALPRPQPLHLSATVYRSAASAPRTHVRVWTQDATPITFWSSADFALIAGIQNFTDSQGGTHQLFLGWGNADLDLLRQRHATGLSPTPTPDIPSLPEGTATFTLTSGTPDAATLSALQVLNELYQREHPRLLEAWQGRETARLQADPRTDGNSNFGFTGLEATSPDQQNVLDLVGALTSSYIDVFVIATGGTFLVQNEELAHGLTNRTARTCWVLGRPSGNYNDPDDVLSTIAHEIGHVLEGYGHPNVQGGPAPLSGTDRTKRLLCSGPNRSLANGKLLVKKVSDAAEEWLIDEERERRMAP